MLSVLIRTVLQTYIRAENEEDNDDTEKAVMIAPSPVCALYVKTDSQSRTFDVLAQTERQSETREML